MKELTITLLILVSSNKIDTRNINIYESCYTWYQKNVEMTERDLKKIWPESEWNRRHLQIIFFGREFCPARNHNLSDCIICGWAATKKRIMHESLSR